MLISLCTCLCFKPRWNKIYTSIYLYRWLGWSSRGATASGDSEDRAHYPHALRGQVDIVRGRNKRTDTHAGTPSIGRFSNGAVKHNHSGYLLRLSTACGILCRPIWQILPGYAYGRDYLPVWWVLLWSVKNTGCHLIFIRRTNSGASSALISKLRNCTINKNR